MAQAVHFFDRLASPLTTFSNTLTPIQTITAAELTTAGFAPNDDVLIVWFWRLACADFRPHHWVSILYNSTELMWSVSHGHLAATGTANIERTYMFMERVNLGGTVSDIVTRHRTDETSSVTTHHSEVLVIRLADFGTENTDWFWNKSTTAVLNTTTYSATSRAAVTWTPDSVEDWVYLAQVHTAIDSENRLAEGRVTLDGAFNSGDWSFAGKTTHEELSLVWFGRLNSLSVASHTLAMETRDQPLSANDHRNSRLFVFRKDVWPDLFTHMPGSVDVTTGAEYTANQVATITDTLSVEQPLVMFGNGHMDINALSAGNASHMWVREAGTTVLEPVSDIATGLFSQWSYHGEDEYPLHWFGYKAAASGTLDLDLFATHSRTTNTRALLDTKFLVWGMEIAGSGGGGGDGGGLMLMGVG